MLEQRAAAVRAYPKTAPVGTGLERMQAFSAELRAEEVKWKGEDRVRLQGIASVVERKYQMYDMFGPYEEVIDRGAFDDTLARNPDVAFLVNHRGVTMARTKSGSLELRMTDEGLAPVAFVNPKRQDVSDLVVAIEDREIDEMSFAFRIAEDGVEWDEDFTVCRIARLDIDRGDVSAVNYGANPYTSIAARSNEILSALERLPLAARKAAMERLREIGLPGQERAEVEAEPAVEDEVREEAPAPTGRSLAQVQALLDLARK